MAISDRRSGSERRNTKRYSANLDIEWEGVVGRQQGMIGDISTTGCFILCSGEVKNGETVKIFIPLADGMKVEFWGEVVNHVLEIGFGANFAALSTQQREFLDRIVNSVNE
ncbi:MAG: PilZ domain-containing protein [Pyrinomonadaceae bacterium]